MSALLTPVEKSLTLAAPSGHHRDKVGGDTVYRGPLQNLPYPSRQLDVESAIKAMYTDGYVIYPGALSAEEVTRYRALMDTRGEPDSSYDMPKWCFNKHIFVDYARDIEFLPCIDKPGIVEVAEAIHDPDCYVRGGTLWVTGPGRSMGMHVDYLPLQLPESVHEDPAVKMPIFLSTAHFYLNDMVEELGPTTLIPGSHRAGRPPYDESTWHGIAPKSVMVKAGDACLFRSDLWHGAAMNSSKERRYMIQVFYGTGVLGVPPRIEASCTPEVLQRATGRQRKLLGII